MSIPTFDGVSCFGRKLTFRPEPEPRADAQNPSFPYDGLNRLDGGSRGTRLHFEGEHFAPTPAALAALHAGFRALNDGRTAQLLDPDGRLWWQTILMDFKPLAPVTHRPGSGEYCQRYRAEFLSLEA